MCCAPLAGLKVDDRTVREELIRPGNSKPVYVSDHNALMATFQFGHPKAEVESTPDIASNRIEVL